MGASTSKGTIERADKGDSSRVVAEKGLRVGSGQEMFRFLSPSTQSKPLKVTLRVNRFNEGDKVKEEVPGKGSPFESKGIDDRPESTIGIGTTFDSSLLSTPNTIGRVYSADPEKKKVPKKLWPYPHSAHPVDDDAHSKYE